MGTLTMHQSGPIYLPSMVNSAEDWWTSLREGSPAKTSVSPETVPASTGLEAAFGGKCLESFGKWDQDTSSLRTYQASFWEDKPVLWSESFPPSGTMRSGTAYRLRPLVPHTSVGGGGALLPTPGAQDGFRSNFKPHSIQVNLQNGGEMHLIYLLRLMGYPDSIITAIYEAAMGVPIGWTALEPLETGLFRQWWQDFCGASELLNAPDPHP